MEKPNELPVSLDAEAQHRYLSYALSVITARALPDVRDGLKPVQRRILYAMSRMGLGFGGANGNVGASLGPGTSIPGAFKPDGSPYTFNDLGGLTLSNMGIVTLPNGQKVPVNPLKLANGTNT